MALFRKAKKTRVLIGGVEANDVNLLSVEIYSGSARADVAVFERNALPGSINYPITDTPTSVFKLGYPTDENPVVQVGHVLANGNTEWIHYGRLVGGGMSITESGAVPARQQSRFDGHMLGDTITYFVMQVDTVLGRKTIRYYLNSDLVFNPVVQGVSIGNRSTSGTTVPIFGNVMEIPLTMLNGTSNYFDRWSVADAATYLLYTYNASQTHVRNPSPAQIYRILPNDQVLNNFSIPAGMNLAQALDALIKPFGFEWHIRHRSQTVRDVFFFSRNSDYQTAIRITGQKPNTRVDDGRDPAPRSEIRWDIVDRNYTAVRVTGAKPQTEFTFPLLPAWDSSLEGQAIDNYIWDSPAMMATPNLRNVYRRYRADLTEFLAVNITADSTARRRLLPCITLGPDGNPFGNVAGTHVEFSLDEGSTWAPIGSAGENISLKDSLHCQLLDDEAGIIFSGRLFPSMSLKFKEKFALRVTAAVEEDQPISFLATHPGSFLRDPRVLFIDGSSQFQKKSIAATSALAGYSQNAAIDGTAEMIVFAATILNGFKTPAVMGSVEFSGADVETASFIGRSVKEIPRKIDLTLGQLGKYPSIVGIEIDIENQVTRMHLGAIE